MKKIHLIISFVSCSIIGIFLFLLSVLARIDPPELISTVLMDIVTGGIIAFAIFSLVQLILFSKLKKIKISKIFGIIFWVAVTSSLIFWHILTLLVRAGSWKVLIRNL